MIFKTESCFSGVLGYPRLAVLGVLGSDDVEWSWFLLARFFAFHHVIISGVRCSSCLWLELVPSVILLASVSTPGSPTLSWVPVVRALSSGKLSCGKGGTQRSGSQLCLLAEDESSKRTCLRSSVASGACVFSCVDWSLRNGGYKMAISPESRDQSLPWRPTLLWRGM